MSAAVILSAVRTPIGRYGGALAGVRPDDLAAVAVRAAVDRAGVEAGDIEDVYLGCANQAGEDNRDVARMAVLLAGLPQSVAGVTVNRLCASGLSAVVSACHAVMAGDGDLFVAGGVESMTRAPLSMPKPEHAWSRGHRTVFDTTLGWRYPNPRLEAMFPLESMGETGENVAERYGVSREDQDAFALRSQRAWAEAQQGYWPALLREASTTTGLLAGVCTGTMLLAEAGLVGTRRATTHHTALGDLAASGATALTDRVVDDGDLLTCGGVTSGIDLALWLVEREFDGGLADQVAAQIAHSRTLPSPPSTSSEIHPAR